MSTTESGVRSVLAPLLVVFAVGAAAYALGVSGASPARMPWTWWIGLMVLIGFCAYLLWVIISHFTERRTVTVSRHGDVVFEHRRLWRIVAQQSMPIHQCQVVANPVNLILGNGFLERQEHGEMLRFVIGESDIVLGVWKGAVKEDEAIRALPAVFRGAVVTRGPIVQIRAYV